MFLDIIASVSTIIQAIVVVITLIFIYLQLRQSNELARAENAQSLVEHAANFNLMLIQDAELTRLWYSQGRGLDNDTDWKRYRYLLIQWLNFHDNVFYQYTKHLLDKSVFTGWRQDLKYTVKNHNMEFIFDELESFFPGEFGHYLVQLKEES